MPTVYPVAGRYLNGVPHVVHECEDPFCTESGAFTTEPPPAEADTNQDPPDGGSPDTTED